MGFIRRILAIGLGLGASVLAVKILQNYERDRYIEGEFTELFDREEEPAAPAAQPQPAEPARPAQKPDNGPNVNPVTLGAAERPVDENGRLDPTRIADPADFGDWDDLGCQG